MYKKIEAVHTDIIGSYNQAFFLKENILEFATVKKLSQIIYITSQYAICNDTHCRVIFGWLQIKKKSTDTINNGKIIIYLAFLIVTKNRFFFIFNIMK